jgi:ribonuclease P protein component
MDAPLGRLTRRPEFLRVAERGRRFAAPGLVLQSLPRPANQPAAGKTVARDAAEIRLGLTASRKVGGAVQRNRARRRLRALARQVLPDHGAPGHDYVLVARGETVTRDWKSLVGDLETALRRLGQWRGQVA